MKKIFLFVMMSIFCLPHVMGQKIGIDALRDSNAGYPQLMAKFGDELEQQRADYIFMIDVSGTMYEYKDIVVPSLYNFINALHDGDYVSLYKFGRITSRGEVGGSERISSQTKIDLCKTADGLYIKPPKDSPDYNNYYISTDLYSMLCDLDKDLQSVSDRNRMKFVFIISDFVHEAGDKDWQGLKDLIINHNLQKYIKVFALELPPESTVLPVVTDKVKAIFDSVFSYDSYSLAKNYSSESLSQWFVQRKDDVMLEKFKGIVGEKFKDVNLQLVLKMDINGNVDMDVSWKPNELFNSIRITSVNVSNNDFSIEGYNPIVIGETNATISDLKIKYNHLTCWPAFHKFNGDIVVTAEYDAPYMNELCRLLGNETSSIEATASQTKNLFCHYLTLGQFIIVVIITLFYILMVILMAARNRKAVFKINGKFAVNKEGRNLCQETVAEKKRSIEIGDGCNFINVPGCEWVVGIRVRTHSPFIPILHFMKPSYEAYIVRGGSFEKGKRKITIGRYKELDIESNGEQYTIDWFVL